MNWYKNAKTSTKLMLAFGLLAALLAVVGYEGIGAASTLNGTLDTLYEVHFLGAVSMSEARAIVPTIGRELRDTLLETDAGARQRSAQNLQADFSALEEVVSAAAKNVVSAEGKAELAKFRRLEPEYRGMGLDIARLAVQRQDKEAFEGLTRARALADELANTCDNMVKIKENVGRKSHEDSETLYASMRLTLIALLAGAVVLAIGMGLFISRLISHPLGKTVEVLRAMSGRDLTKRLEIKTTDEVGEMAEALNQACAEIRQAMSEVRDAASGVASAAEQLASASEELSSGTQEQASSQEETSTSLQELSTAVKQNADNARQASQLASGARDAADKGGAVVNSAVTAMAEINASSKRIADIITAIDEIAFQTNLLALNAAVEAARAGEQGRGFAVVAAEVRSLAQRSATAAKEIKALIQDSVRKVEAGSELVNRSGQTLTEIMASVKRVTDIVGEIAAASHQQSVGIEQVTKAMGQMDQVTQTNSAQTEELSSTSQTLATHANQMQAMVGMFVLDSGTRRDPAKPAPKAQAKPQSHGSTGRSLAKLSKQISTASPAPPVFEEF